MHIVVERIYVSHLIYLHNITWEFLADVKNIQTCLVVRKCISYIMLPRLFSNGYFLFEFKAMLAVDVYILCRNLTNSVSIDRTYRDVFCYIVSPFRVASFFISKTFNYSL